MLTSLISSRDWRPKEVRDTVALLKLVSERLDRSSDGNKYQRIEKVPERDGWGRELRISYAAEGTGERLRVSSAGLDGAWGTEDDLHHQRYLFSPQQTAKGLTKGLLEGAKESAKESVKKRLPWGKSDKSTPAPSAPPGSREPADSPAKD